MPVEIKFDGKLSALVRTFEWKRSKWLALRSGKQSDYRHLQLCLCPGLESACVSKAKTGRQ